MSAKEGRARANPTPANVFALDGVAPATGAVLTWDSDGKAANTAPENLEVVASLLNNGLSDPPEAAVAYRGRVYVKFGGEGAADTVLVCVKDASEAYAWVDLLTTPAA